MSNPKQSYSFSAHTCQTIAYRLWSRSTLLCGPS